LAALETFDRDLGINIACYIQQIQLLTEIAINESEKELHRRDQLTDKARLKMLDSAMKLSRALEEEIYTEVRKKEGKSYDFNSNEMNLLALSAILAGWSGWVFKSKSEDPNRVQELRGQAAAESKYVETFIRNAINAGRSLGKDGGTPEGKSLLIEID
jgi:hypothetical protein